MFRYPTTIGAALGVFLLLLTACTEKAVRPEEVPADALIPWNEAIYETALQEDGLLTLKGLRTATLSHLAAHDALNAVVPLYQTYLPRADASGADPQAAAIYAVYTICASQYPEHSAHWDNLLTETLPLQRTEDELREARELGQTSAERMLAARSGDGWDGEAEYNWHPMGPGVYAEFNEHSGTPEGFVFGAGWARARPFLLESPDAFRSPPPPEIGSSDYAAAFEEVKEVGRDSSASRSPDQAHLAMWWKDFVENSHNRLARQLVQKEGLNLWEAARLFALLNAGIYDAYVNVFDNKFHYNHWRPYTAIRWASHDGNPATEEDPEWNNLHGHTYAFPSYPSAHGTASAAAMTVLAGTLGKGDAYAFEMRTDSVDRAGPFSGKIAMDPPTRSFGSFSEAAREAAISRLYLGIHFRYDSEEGFELGRQIGVYALTNFLGPAEPE